MKTLGGLLLSEFDTKDLQLDANGKKTMQAAKKEEIRLLKEADKTLNFLFKGVNRVKYTDYPL